MTLPPGAARRSPYFVWRAEGTVTAERLNVKPFRAFVA
jgi:hypothetical protein